MSTYEIEVITNGKVTDYIYKEFDCYETAVQICEYNSDIEEGIIYRVVSE